MSKKAYIDPKKCDGAPTCPVKKVCPAKALIQNKPEKAGFFWRAVVEVDEEKCTGCGICVNVCPMKAVSMR